MRLHFQIYFNRQRNTDRLIRTTVITDLIRNEKGDEQRHNLPIQLQIHLSCSYDLRVDQRSPISNATPN